MMDLDGKRRAAVAAIRRLDRLVVALSGGVDSGVLLALAAHSLGPPRVIAVTGVSPAVPRSDVDDARAVARHVGVAHETVGTDELSRPGYRANRGLRCYHCRHELFGKLAAFARRRGFRTVAYGAIADDLGDFRPGMQAADERGVAAPLLEAGFIKEEIRRLARREGLPVHDKPASPCLASRIPAGTAVSARRLGRVGRAEEGLHELGLRLFRVRFHGELARIELGPDDLARVRGDADLRVELSRRVRQAGFRHVALDPRGYRMGSGNPTRDGGQ